LGLSQLLLGVAGIERREKIEQEEWVVRASHEIESGKKYGGPRFGGAKVQSQERTVTEKEATKKPKRARNQKS